LKIAFDIKSFVLFPYAAKTEDESENWGNPVFYRLE
jgi:hypothetical protein